jgi:CRP/FNR family transcriptional regulator, cyclic AMP receptor protein
MRRRSVGSDGPERLNEIEFFDGLTEAQRRMLARLVDELDADPGDVLMEEGDFGYEAIFIEDGTAEIRQGGETVNTVGRGQIVGELALVDPDGKRTSTVVAVSPLRALSLTSHAVREVQARMPDVAAAIDRAAAEHHQRDRLRGQAEPSG